MGDMCNGILHVCILGLEDKVNLKRHYFSRIVEVKHFNYTNMGARSGGGASGGMGSRSRSGASSWPTLTGSEKQISWANDIRGRAQKALDFLKQNISVVPNTEAAKTVFSKWESKMKSMTSASQWIDARYDAPGKLAGNNSNYSPLNNVRYTMSVFDNWLGH